MAAIGKVVSSGKENIVAITPSEPSGMMAYPLRHQSELRDHEDCFRDIKDVKIPVESLELAESMIVKRTAPFDIGKSQDGYELE